MEFLTNTHPELINCAILILRIFIGICFVVHGMGKLGLVGSGNMHGFTEWLRALKIPFPALNAKLAMFSEIIGGTLLACGLCTRPACLILFFTMAVAALVGHKGGGYLITNKPPGNEYTINLMAVLVALFLLGPGLYSLDAFLF